MTLYLFLNSSNITGGSGTSANWNYQWRGLPGNCTSANVTIYTCVPNTTGPYSVTVMVTDRVAGVNATSPMVAVTVNTDPVVSSFTVSSGSVGVGGSISFTVSAAGGTPPYLYVYLGLPSGCAGNTSTLTCSPTVAQTYNVTVYVVDAVGMSSNVRALPVSVTTAATAAKSGPTPVEWGAIAAILVVGLAISAALLLRARKEERTSYAAAPRPPVGGTPPSSPPPT
jgi:hypothetical protein